MTPLPSALTLSMNFSKPREYVVFSANAETARSVTSWAQLGEQTSNEPANVVATRPSEIFLLMVTMLRAARFECPVVCCEIYFQPIFGLREAGWRVKGPSPDLLWRGVLDLRL